MPPELPDSTADISAFAEISSFTGRLGGLGDTQLLHPGLERGSLHPEMCGSTIRPGEAPMSSLESLEDVLALDLL